MRKCKKELANRKNDVSVSVGVCECGKCLGLSGA